MKDFIAREGMMPTVIDFTGVSSIEIQVSDLANRGKKRSQMTAQPRVFVSGDPLLFGLLRVYGTYQDTAGGRQPSIVHTLAEAFQELSLTDPEFEPVVIMAHRTDIADILSSQEAGSSKPRSSAVDAS